MLIDFGHASSPGRLEHGGTPWYVAPEILSGSRGPPADVFALGVVMLYVMRRISLPEKWGKYPQWQLGKVRSKQTAALQAMEEWQKEIRSQAEALAAPLFAREAKLCDLVRRMLVINPEQRISSSELAGQTESWDPAKIGME